MIEVVFRYIVRPSVHSFHGPFFVCSFVLSFGHRLHYSIVRRLIGLSVAFVLSVVRLSIHPYNLVVGYAYIITFLR